jgi:hypothetical protein
MLGFASCAKDGTALQAMRKIANTDEAMIQNLFVFILFPFPRFMVQRKWYWKQLREEITIQCLMRNYIDYD